MHSWVLAALEAEASWKQPQAASDLRTLGSRSLRKGLDGRLETSLAMLTSRFPYTPHLECGVVLEREPSPIEV